MSGRVFLAAVLAGIVASLVMSAVQHFRLTPLIVAAEVFETGEHEHAAGGAAVEAETWSPSDGLERTAYTILANLVVGVAFALVISGAALLLGLPMTMSNGLLWGIAGFLVFSLAPAAGLPPELPGMPAADLGARQLWWGFAAVATGIGLALITSARRGLVTALGIAVLALPHLFGAPQAPAHDTALPAHLAAAFAVNSIAAAAIFWAVLGALLGFFNDRVKPGSSSVICEKIPATVITGFLGAGKTTLIRHLLATANGRRLALIINEFGDVGVDAEIVKGCASPGCREEDVIELANGCICCTVADDFIPAMSKLLERDSPPEHIIIETSGLALPQPLVRAFQWPEIRSRVTVDGVVTVVDGAAVADRPLRRRRGGARCPAGS